MSVGGAGKRSYMVHVGFEEMRAEGKIGGLVIQLHDRKEVGRQRSGFGDQQQRQGLAVECGECRSVWLNRRLVDGRG